MTAKEEETLLPLTLRAAAHAEKKIMAIYA